ncbi:hypothetical protein K492DRAFT_197120 [Lichtheimia hyalospora FSU 10163]|nr:hypothetical protein K492DRAFT_197120 [Lichtheimia hyalospora FSU 10163]
MPSSRKNRIDNDGVQEPPNESSSAITGSTDPYQPSFNDHRRSAATSNHETADEPPVPISTDTNTSSSSLGFPSWRRKRRPTIAPKSSHSSSLPEGMNDSSSSSRWSASWRQTRRRSSAALSALFLHKRRTFPPASRILKKEKQRFMHPASSTKSARHHYGNSSKNKKSIRMKRRHSLGAILGTFTLYPACSGSSSSRLHRSSYYHDKYSSVRSSMVLHLSDEDMAAAGHVPEVLYDEDDDDDDHDHLSLHSASTSCQYCMNISNPSSEASGGCPHRTRQFGSLHHQQQQRSSGTSDGGNWLYSWVQHHPRRKSKQRIQQQSSQKTTATTTTTEKFIRPPTISSGSSLSNKLDSLIHNPYHGTTNTTTTAPRRFSAFWIDTHGRSGKQQVHVDDKGHVSLAPQSCCCNGSSHCERKTYAMQSSMFLFGFLFFPLWWFGAWIYVRHHRTRLPTDLEATQKQSVSLVNARIVGQLNCWMSILSLILACVLVGLGVWCRYAS